VCMIVWMLAMTKCKYMKYSHTEYKNTYWWLYKQIYWGCWILKSPVYLYFLFFFLKSIYIRISTYTALEHSSTSAKPVCVEPTDWNGRQRNIYISFYNARECIELTRVLQHVVRFEYILNKIWEFWLNLMIIIWWIVLKIPIYQYNSA
jgi:hypothetical protein